MKPFKNTAQPVATMPILAGAVGKIYLSRFSDKEAKWNLLVNIMWPPRDGWPLFSLAIMLPNKIK